MNFQQLETFCAVINEKSMTAASAKLFLTQPAVSQQIRNLEEELGVALLVRGVRQVKPTPEGVSLFNYAKKITRLVNEAKIAIQTMGAEVSGPLRIATLNSIGLHLIGPIFSLFLKNNSKVQLKLKYASGRDILLGLTEGEIDLALLPDADLEYGGDPDQFQKKLVFQEEMWLVSGPNKESTPEKIKLKDIENFPYVSLSGEYPGFEKQLYKELKKRNSIISPVFESQNVGTIKRVVESGIGWGFLPSHSIRKQVQARRLKKVEIEDFSYSVKLYCYYPPEERMVGSIRVFLDGLLQQSSI